MSLSRIRFINTHFLTSVAASGLIVLANSFPLSARSADSTPTATDNYAFLVAIDDYISPNINKLSGCKKDIHDIEAVLVKNHFPNDGDHIKVLTDHQATKQAIIDGFRSQLVENAKKHPNAMFYFQYSGHGSRVQDEEGGDEDGYDETIVPADSRTPGHFDLVDKEIAPLIGELTKYTANAILCFDSCHSGNVTRGDVVTREISEDKRPQPKHPNLKAVPRELESDNGLVPRSDKYIAFSACLPTETAQETTDERSSDRNGLMTRNLLAALSKAKPDTTYRQLMDSIGQNMAPLGQHPQIEGDLDRVVFGTSTKRSDASLKVSQMSGKTLTVDGGSNLGLTEGSVIAFYKGSALKLVGEKDLLCKGTITKVGPLSSEVSIPATIDLKESDAMEAKAVIASPKLTAEPQRIMLEVPASSKLNTSDAKRVLSEFEEETKSDPLVKIAGREADPFGKRSADFDVVVANDLYKTFASGQKADASQAQDSPVYFITNSSGTPLFNFFVSPGDPAAATKITEAIHKKCKQDYLRSLGNQLSPLNNKLKLKVVRVLGYKTEGSAKLPIEEIRDVDQQGSPHLNIGDKFRLQVENTSDTPLYVNVLTLGTSGNIRTVYSGRSKALPAGATMKTPVMTIGLPLGMESLKVIATTKPADFSVLEQNSVTRDVRAVPEGNSPLERLVQQALTRDVSTTRDASVDDGQTFDDWTTAKIDYLIKDPTAVATK